MYDAIPYATRYQNMRQLSIPLHTVRYQTIQCDLIIILQVGMNLHCRVTRINMERLQLDLTCRSSDLLDKEGKYRFRSVSVFLSFRWINLRLVCTSWKPLRLFFLYTFLWFSVLCLLFNNLSSEVFTNAADQRFERANQANRNQSKNSLFCKRTPWHIGTV